MSATEPLDFKRMIEMTLSPQVRQRNYQILFRHPELFPFCTLKELRSLETSGNIENDVLLELANGKTVKVEFKNYFKHVRSDIICLEQKSNKEAGTLGWTFKTDADFVIFVWHKGYPATGELQGYNFREVHELILFAQNKKPRKLNWKRWSEGELKPMNVIYCTNTKRSNKTFLHDYHPAVKPVELLKALISWSTVEKETVFDPFCGSGSTLVAAEELGRNWIGIEIDPHWYEVARARIHELRKQKGVDKNA